MNKKVSNKIVYLNFILAFLILNLHSAYMELFDTNNTVLVINQFVRIVCNMAVPTFFFVSAMLFYRSCKRKRYKEVIIAKTRSLLIPYLCWNIICFPLKEMKNVFGGGTIASVPEIIRNILSSSYDPVLWFIRVLFIYFLFYPVNVCLLNKKKIYPFLVVVIFFINIYIGPKAGYATCRYWLPVYMLGAYIGYWHHDRVFDVKETKIKYMNIAAAVALQIALFIWAMNNNYGLFVCRMISPIFYWVIADIFQNLRHPLWVMKQSFFYYCKVYGQTHDDIKVVGPSSGRFNPLDYISESALNKLTLFCNAANKSTGSSHPCDEERWFDFICQTVDDGRVFDYDTLSKFLQDEEYWGKKEKEFLGVIGQFAWSEENAEELASEYDNYVRILQYYKKTRLGE